MVFLFPPTAALASACKKSKGNSNNPAAWTLTKHPCLISPHPLLKVGMPEALQIYPRPIDAQVAKYVVRVCWSRRAIAFPFAKRQVNFVLVSAACVSQVVTFKVCVRTFEVASKKRKTVERRQLRLRATGSKRGRQVDVYINVNTAAACGRNRCG